MRISSHLKFIGWLFSSRSLMWDCFFRKQILQLNEQYQHFHQFSSKQSKARVFLKGNIFHGVARYERMKNWAKFAQNAILLHCPFLFIENLTFPSSISFPMNMEGSKRTNTSIGHLYSSTKNMQKNKKDITLWQKVCCLTIHQIALSLLWPQPVGKPVAFVEEMEQ